MVLKYKREGSFLMWLGSFGKWSYENTMKPFQKWFYNWDTTE